jgi:DNA primase
MHSEATDGLDRNQLELINRWAAQYFRKCYDDPVIGQRAREYVASRGIEIDTARRFGLGWARENWDDMTIAAQKSGQNINGLTQVGLLVQKEQGGCYDRFRERLMFPVIDALGRVIAFGGRTLGDDPAKYLNSPESVIFIKSRALYGLHAAKDAIVKERLAVIVEGYTDCIMAHQYGVKNVVATLGTALTADHVRVLSRYADRIVLVFDSDEAGQKASDRAVEIFLAQNVELRLATIPEGKDPCDFLLLRGRDAFQELIDKATDAIEYKWKTTKERVTQSDTINGRKRAVEDFMTLIARTSAQGNMDSISRGFLVNHIAKLVEMPSEEVHQRINQLQKRLPQRNQLNQAEARTEEDARSRSYREILEVLLNRPELFEVVKQVIVSPDDLSHPDLLPIAQRVWRYCSGGGRGTLGEILAGCESVTLCKIMTDMAEQGAVRGNFESTLAGALRNWRRIQNEEARREVKELVLSASKKYGDDTEAAMLMDYQSKCEPDPRRVGLK